MKYKIHSFRYGKELFSNEQEFLPLWKEIQTTLDSIKDEELILYYNNSTRSSKKSISDAINFLINERLCELGWRPQSPIFNDADYKSNGKRSRWTLDFAKDTISVEVAFNHGEAVAWNLIKPVLASELNHIEKAIQTKAGVIITATKSMKKAGNLDGAAGTYEKYLQYLNPFRNILTVPLVIIGLEPPESFIINKKTKEVELL
ncbi:hypothetical protein BEH_24675 (plasmid) [Priestia filamentosa]|uniref:Restriction endonuclease n=1 Tax=Priestia filamentosa TaxID=1402861 RepID=A0A2S1M0K6_9BACI|nr:BglII/BstYI family type II restriction endonuclease [Priestia filamentosa]AWG44896.1 hypothetical protein BEH_24675 [Priestia filamentosa]